MGRSPDAALPPFNPETATRDEMEARVKDLQGQVSNPTDDAQLANIDLQNMMQRQQQTVQTLSEVSKTMDDTVMAILRKIG